MVSADKTETEKLRTAIEKNDRKSAIAAVNSGADVEVMCGPFKEPPLHWAIRNHFTNAVDSLLERGARVDSTDEGRNTPLHIAAQQGYESLAEQLIRSGADVNACDVLLNTPLHVATANQHTEVIKALLSHGAKSRLENLDRKTAIDIAVHRRDVASVNLMIDALLMARGRPVQPLRGHDQPGRDKLR